MSYFNQFKKEIPGSEGYAFTWQQPNGIEHSELIDAIHEEIGFCGCGDPHAAIEYVYLALKWISEMRQCLDRMEREVNEGKRKRMDKDPVYSQMWDDELKRFGSEGAQYFMWYWLDDHKLTEHGGTVPGWLTTKGEGIMIDIKEALNL